MPDGGSVADRSDFDLGTVRVRPAMRTLETASSRVGLEPLAMQLLLTLSRRAGRLVTRQQAFDACWGSAAVGDDSLNRAVAVLRKALRTISADGIRIETIPASGYVLRLTAESASPELTPDVEDAIRAGYDSWRLGLPEPDHLRLEMLRKVTAGLPDCERAWGMLALLCRQAAEYADPVDVAAFVSECESAARRALVLDGKQGEALVALASVAPLYGRWRAARAALTGILERIPDHMIVLHDLAILEMATGRVRAAKATMDALRVRDPLAACLCYKSIYQHWSVNDLAGLDDIGDRAIQLWPNHPAVWMARFWTYAHTARGHAALAMLDDVTAKPNLPEATIRLLRGIVSASLEGSGSRTQEAAVACRAAAARGPAQAILALQGLGLLGCIDDLFDVANAYYLRLGSDPVPLRRTSGEPSVNDQHRRVTQMLFTPALTDMRADPRFMPMCARMGLAAYWEAESLSPDFLEIG
jgi:DNA-binding winged helix-turn-helix (wHTH) protein